MKTLKAIITIGILTLCAYTIAAQDKKPKPQKETLADIIIGKLDKDVQLTDSQKIVLKNKFNTLVKKSEDADKKSNKNEVFSSKKVAYDEYEAALDSILSTTQKQQLNSKNTEREKGTK